MVFYSRNSFSTAKSTHYNGTWYDSMFEAGHAQELDLLIKANQIKDWNRQVVFVLHGVNGDKVCEYWADFVVTNNDDSQEVHETKGRSTDIFRLKWKLLEAEYGELYTLVLIQQKSWYNKRRTFARK